MHFQGGLASTKVCNVTIRIFIFPSSSAYMQTRLNVSYLNVTHPPSRKHARAPSPSHEHGRTPKNVPVVCTTLQQRLKPVLHCRFVMIGHVHRRIRGKPRHPMAVAGDVQSPVARVALVTVSIR